MKVLLFFIILIAFLYIQNNMLVTTYIKYASERLPQRFDGFRIVHLSDLHGKEFGRNSQSLLSKVKGVEPDLIVITGDLISATSYDEKAIIILAEGLKSIAPVYYVTGNHEIANRNFVPLAQKLAAKGIHILRNSADKLKKDGDTILLAGIDDPISTSSAENALVRQHLNKELEEVLDFGGINGFTILLTHRPEHFSLYAQRKIDLIFAGHAHGGQIRLPFLGSLYAPNQGYFPKYTSGKYTEQNSAMVVSRGLGNSSISQRLFNQPQIVIVTLFAK